MKLEQRLQRSLPAKASLWLSGAGGVSHAPQGFALQKLPVVTAVVFVLWGCSPQEGLCAWQQEC